MTDAKQKGRNKHGKQDVVSSIDFGCNSLTTFDDCNLKDKRLDDWCQYQTHNNHEKNTLIFHHIWKILPNDTDKKRGQ